MPLSKPSTLSRVCITVSNSPKPSRVYIRQCKHGKGVLLLKSYQRHLLLCFCCFNYTTLVIEITLHINLPVISFIRLVNANVNKYFNKKKFMYFF